MMPRVLVSSGRKFFAKNDGRGDLALVEGLLGTGGAGVQLLDRDGGLTL